MHKFESRFSAEQLKDRWDEYTSPARFAGADETMDLIYVSKRKGEKVKLVRRTSSKREPFSCVFRGKIVSTEQGGSINGFFVKSIIDYIAIICICVLLAYIRYLVIDRGDSPVTVNLLLGSAILIGIALLYNKRSTKQKYAEFISRITDSPNEKFLSKKELRDKKRD